MHSTITTYNDQQSTYAFIVMMNVRACTQQSGEQVGPAMVRGSSATENAQTIIGLFLIMNGLDIPELVISTA